MGIESWVSQGRLNDHFTEITQIVHEFPQSGHVMLGTIVPGVDEILLGFLLVKRGSAVRLSECKARTLSDRRYIGMVVIGETVALIAIQCSM